ncbi:MAG: alanine--tRNA ligase [Candidatus Paracaedibacteraceae bacterium]|nr:alanine--tRNA ligase [Candidatus Paracaedibacteraceae bacterium]
MKTLADIRRTFIDYFIQNGHTHVASSPLVPQNDPTLMFTAAGMVQFKDLFTGIEKRSYTRAVTSQKCVRAGGKHNDLDNVGYTARHHTFFEMLGNFSFGDYFKEEAIYLAHNLITKEYGLDQKRLLVTVYADDDEAVALWKKIGGFTDDKIIRIATSDNFWSMGDTGPCGPCSEIFFDHGDKIAGGPPGSPDEDGDRFIEIWNLVFMQFEQMADGTRIKLPNPSIDTGMGLERVSSVLQGKHNNFDTDLFAALIDASQSLTGNTSLRQSHNVIADHLRASAFLIADGVLPSNEGRGYVLRRIMRRGMRHAHILGAKNPLMWQLVPALIQQMGEAFPEICRTKTLIEQTLLLEEERFRQTLDRGLKVLNESTSTLSPNEPLPGHVAFRLYDTYGFPLDLTQDVLRGENREVDVFGFNSNMEEQRKKARASWVGTGDNVQEQIWFDVREQHGATDFLGYATANTEAVIQSIIKEGKCVKEAIAGDQVWVVLNQTPFYAESGGQVGDTGTIKSIVEENGFTLNVTDCVKKVDSLFAHLATVVSGIICENAPVKVHVDSERRNQIAANHSATHLLQAALRTVLGDHVCQKGSLVDANRLRFDFTHQKALTNEEWTTVERLVNKQIYVNQTVQIKLATPEKAIEEGAMALFGERYGDEVRVVSLGSDRFSVELCGGIHVKATGDIGIFKLMSESSVSSGVRRIEAITSLSVLNYLNTTEETLSIEREQNKKTQNDLNKQIQDLKKELALNSDAAAVATRSKRIGNYNTMSRTFVNVSANDLKSVVDKLKSEIESGIVIVTSTDDNGKVSLVVGVTSDLTSRISAVDLARRGAEILGGQGGGGRPDLAQAGGINADAISGLVEKLIAGL